MRKIIWEKWVDPFLSNIDEFNLPGDEDEEDDDDDDESEGYRDSFETAESLMRDFKKGGSNQSNTGPVMVGPMGIIPLNEHNVPSKIYTFWMGHTNFDIDDEAVTILDETPGVETLDIFTRYRFRIAIGKAFLLEDPFGKNVMLEVEKRLRCGKTITNTKQIVQPKPDTNIKMLKNHLSKKYNYWAIFALPDGTLYPTGAASKEEVEQEGVVKQMSIVATSWE